MSRIDQLQKMLADSPEDPDLPYMLAQEYGNAGQLDRAIELYDRCLALQPDYHYAYFHKARALESLNRNHEAVETLQLGLARATESGSQKAMDEIRTYLAALETE